MRLGAGLDVGQALSCARFAIKSCNGHPPARLIAHYRHLELLAATSSETETTQPSDEPVWITTTEAAEILGWTPAYVRREKVARSLDGFRVSDSFWIFDRKKVEEHAAQRIS